LACCIGLALLVAAPSFSAPPAQASKPPAVVEAERLTQQFAALNKRHRRASAGERPEVAAELLETAKRRQALLGELIEGNPGEVLRLALPDRLGAGLPAQVQAYLEQRLELEGELKVLHVDYEDPRQSHPLYLLETGQGERFSIHFAAQPPALLSGSRIRARGLGLFGVQTRDSGETDGGMVLMDGQTSLELIEADGSDGSSDGTTTAAILPNTFGEQETLVLLVNFQDNPVEPYTVTQTWALIFGTVNDFYQENSNGQTWLAGDLSGYYTLPIDQTCDAFGMDSYVWQAAADDGIDIGSYRRLIYIFPKVSDCGWTGMGTVGGTPSRAWINGALELRTLGHELGHNLGLRHARALDCGSEIIGDNCISITYGDGFDIMGASGITGHFNVFNKELLGWLTSAAGEVITAEGDGVYLLEPYETIPAGLAKGLKVLRGIDSTSGQPLWYYLEYRQAEGFDSFLEGKPVTDGVLFHLGTEADADTSELLDMTPESIWYDLDDASLVSGSSYTDPEAGVTITTEWADADGAGVRISYIEPSCILSNPTLSLSPSESVWTEAGTSVSYSATVTNQDSIGCAASDFSVTAEPPAGWSADSASLNLSPGASGRVGLNITSDETAVDGFYDILIRALNSSDNHYQSDGTVTYVVDTPAPACVSASPLLSLSSLDGEPVEPGTPVSYSATLTNQDSSGCEAALFDVTASVPAGWLASSASLALDPSENSTVTLTVTSATTAAEGIYTIDINAQNLADGNYYSNATATYYVTTPVPACEAAAPLLALSSNTSTEVIAGTKVQYTGTLTNRDGSGCESTDFSLIADPPAGWIGDSTSVNLAPGAETPVALSITSPADTEAGLYPIRVHAKKNSDPSSGDSTLVSYRVAAPLNLAPLAVDDSMRLFDKKAVQLDVLANDSDPDGDALTVVQVSQGSQGSVQISADGSLLFTPNPNFKGSDSFEYTVSDGESTANATVSVTLVKNNEQWQGKYLTTDQHRSICWGAWSVI
jgi:hypothetical protein